MTTHREAPAARARHAENSTTPGRIENRLSQDIKLPENGSERLKALVALAKGRGFLTQAEIIDHLPEDVAAADTLDDIIAGLNEIGIAVHEQAPDDALLLLSDAPSAILPEDDADAAIENALSIAEPAYGHSTDPLRAYMRQMGTVALLKREEEIEIARRIEHGLQELIHALSAYPPVIWEILEAARKIANDEMQIDDFVDGLNDGEDSQIASLDSNESEGAAADLSDRQLPQLKKDALAIFSIIADAFDAMGAAYERDGYLSPAYEEAQSIVFG